MSEGLGLDRESWGAALGTEIEEHQRELCSTDVEGEAQERSETCPGHTASQKEAQDQDLREQREPLRGAPSWRGADILPTLRKVWGTIFHCQWAVTGPCLTEWYVGIRERGHMI